MTEADRLERMIADFTAHGWTVERCRDGAISFSKAPRDPRLPIPAAASEPFHAMPASGEVAYPNISAQMWADGQRYVLILARQYANRLPRWFDWAGFEEAGLIALMAAARTYDHDKGAWTTLLNCACRCHFQREAQAQINWHHSRPLYSIKRVEPRPSCSLDAKVTLGGHSARFGDFLPGGLEPETVLEPLAWEQLLQQLSPTDAALVRRLYEDEVPQAEMARELGVSRQTVHLRAKDVRARLRVILESPGVSAG